MAPKLFYPAHGKQFPHFKNETITFFIRLCIWVQHCKSANNGRLPGIQLFFEFRLCQEYARFRQQQNFLAARSNGFAGQRQLKYRIRKQSPFSMDRRKRCTKATFKKLRLLLCKLYPQRQWLVYWNLAGLLGPCMPGCNQQKQTKDRGCILRCICAVNY